MLTARVGGYAPSTTPERNTMALTLAAPIAALGLGLIGTIIVVVIVLIVLSRVL